MGNSVYVQVWQVGEADSEQGTEAEELPWPMIVVVYIFSTIFVGLIPQGVIAYGLIVNDGGIAGSCRPLQGEEVSIEWEIIRGLETQFVVDGHNCKGCH